MRFRRTATLAAAATVAATGLIATASTASAADRRINHPTVTVAPGETSTISASCPSDAPYIVRTGFGYGVSGWLNDDLKIYRGTSGGSDRWALTVTNTSSVDSGTVTMTYTCSTTPTTYNKSNNANVRSGEPPLRVPMNCPSGYPLFDTGTSKQGTAEAKSYAVAALQTDSNSTLVTPTGYPNTVYLTFTSSYPATTNPPKYEWIALSWVCAR
ncbi:hypothetical protein ACH4ZX_28330 [Streptomyces sp. NPDC020490]|uniref:hypothetical protein n=1 Tax=Streptomyces sp. NPDC020490 TaxID=3365078 RepID=UPI00378CC021